MQGSGASLHVDEIPHINFMVWYNSTPMDSPNCWLWSTVVCIYIKISHISGLVQVKPVLSKGQPYYYSWFVSFLSKDKSVKRSAKVVTKQTPEVPPSRRCTPGTHGAIASVRNPETERLWPTREWKTARITKGRKGWDTVWPQAPPREQHHAIKREFLGLPWRYSGYESARQCRGQARATGPGAANPVTPHPLSLCPGARGRDCCAHVCSSWGPCAQERPRDEKHRSEELPPPVAARGSPWAAAKTKHSQK